MPWDLITFPTSEMGLVALSTLACGAALGLRTDSNPATTNIFALKPFITNYPTFRPLGSRSSGYLQVKFRDAGVNIWKRYVARPFCSLSPPNIIGSTLASNYESKTSEPYSSGQGSESLPSSKPGNVPVTGGRIGFVSFNSTHIVQPEQLLVRASPEAVRNSLLWLLGPLTLVASVVIPPLYLRRVFGAMLEDSLLTDFLILVFTEALFFLGASIFLYIAHRFKSGNSSLREERLGQSLPLGYRISSRISLSVGVLLPVVTFATVWPWTGPAAAAALAPYMIGLLVQLSFEHIVKRNHSLVWPLIPITFQVYRLHQLNRAAQLVAGLIYSLKGVESTAETLAINGSLQTILFVLQILGMLCLWSLGAFLTHQLPSRLPES